MEDETFGASNTSKEVLAAYGALAGTAEGGKQAAALARQMYPDPEKANPWVAAYEYFNDALQLASKPGQTTFGTFTGAVPAVMDYYTAKDKELAEAKRARLEVGFKLAPALKKTADKVTSTTKVVSSAQLKVMFPGEKIAEGLYNLTEGSDGSIKIGKVGGAGSTTTINTGDSGSKEFGKSIGKKAGEDYSTQLQASYDSISTLNSFKQLFSLLNSEDFDTGVIESAIMPLQSIARSFGLDALIDTDDLATKELFQAKANELVLASVAKMKGALSDRELGFLAEQNVNLRSTTKGNKFLLLLQMQQIEKSIEFAPFADAWGDANATETGGQITNAKQYRQMIEDWKASPIMSENPYQYISKLSDKRERELVISTGGGYDDNGRIVGLSTEQRKLIGKALEEEFNLFYVENTFNNFLWD